MPISISKNTGIIQNAEDNVVQLVEDMVVSHIRGNCLILVTLPMTDDIENQKALQLARKEDPYGHRTIGVITKPDMLSAGSSQARRLWLDVVEGRRHPLTHGYYCTRQPDDDERLKKITTAEAREAEVNFFNRTAPWKESKYQARFGTANLVATLSVLLVRIITESLPKIQAETASQLAACAQELSQLPKAIDGDPSTHMLQLVTAYCADIHPMHVAGLISKIRNTAPNFKPFVNTTEAQKAAAKWPDADGDEECVSTEAPLYLEDMRRHIEKSITRELAHNVPFEAKVTLIQAFQRGWGGFMLACFESVVGSTFELLLERLKDHFSRYGALQMQLRTHVSELVKGHQEMCLKTLNTMLEVEQTPFTQNDHYLESCIEKWLSVYKDARAGKTCHNLGAARPSKKRTEQEAAKPPAVPPFTPSKVTGSERERARSKQPVVPDPKPSPAPVAPALGFGQKDNVVSNGQKEGVFSSRQFIFRDATPPQSQPGASVLTAEAPPANPFETTSNGSFAGFARKNPHQELVRNALATLAQVGYTGLTEEDLGRLNPVDEYETELQVMAEVRAYFQIAYKRVIDNIPSIIDLTFLKAVAKALQPWLIYKLELGSANAASRCARLLAEDPNVVARREELTGRQKRLESVAVELQKYGL